MKGQYLMTKKIILIVLALVVALGIGCRSSIVKNVHDAPMAFATENKPSIEQIKKAIIVAGSGLGWRIKSQSPGNLIGTLNLREHTAIVDIKYTTENFSITYNPIKFNNSPLSIFFIKLFLFSDISIFITHFLSN